ncbi:MAG TPA: hypothetical protein VGF86_10835 [Candidatus Tumulicola sp.]|jgi:hypothetical protein
MDKRSTKLPAVDTSLGYAADERGVGVAYARIRSETGEHLLRVPFRVGRISGLQQREAGYAALTAVARALRRRGIGSAAFRLGDASLLADLAAHREVPPPIVLPYVRLRCALNQLDEFRLELAADDDLMQRARAEVVLNVAA